jgi:uncharacterized membrane protein
MAKSKNYWTDKKMDLIIASLLHGGVVLAGLVVLTGGGIYLFRYGSALPDFRVFRGEPSDLRNLTGILSDAASLRSRGIIQMGLIILIATPVIRVAFCLGAFLQQRDRLYVGVTLFVLTLLLISLAGGLK